MLSVPECEQLPVSEARSGDPDAWDTLFRRYQLPLYVYACELVHDQQASLDIVQETFIAASRHLGTLRENAKFGSWLFGIAHQKCGHHWRKRGRELDFASDQAAAPEEFEPAPSDYLIRREQEAEFMKLVARLPLPQRSVLLLHFIEEFPLAEIATITGAQLGTVKSRLHYAKQALRELLTERIP